MTINYLQMINKEDSMMDQRTCTYQIRLILSAAVVITSLGALATSVMASPHLLNGTSRECRDSLIVADAAFTSKSFYLNEAINFRPNADVQIVGQKLPGDISGGLGFVVDKGVFSTIDNRGARPLAWQSVPKGKLRWVINANPFGWRGDIYTLYAIDKGINPMAFDPNDAQSTRAIIDAPFVRLIPPVMLRDARTHTVWALDTGDFNQVLGDWSVYAERENGIKKVCTIRFSKPVKTALALLPKAVLLFANELDATMGDGRDEGTLHPTATLRNNIQSAWANAILRPWAMTKQPYNTRRDVDAGLRRWARRAASFNTLYEQIRMQYPIAQQALAELYIERLGKTPQQANMLATRNLDIIYRSHFVFSQEFVRPASKPEK
jgi:hypothetical protein